MSKLYLKCTTDKFELPEAVAESTQELARMIGRSAGSVATMISKGYPGYCKVEVECWPDNDGGLWTYDENGRAVVVE